MKAEEQFTGFKIHILSTFIQNTLVAAGNWNADFPSGVVATWQPSRSFSEDFQLAKERLQSDIVATKPQKIWMCSQIG